MPINTYCGCAKAQTGRLDRATRKARTCCPTVLLGLAVALCTGCTNGTRNGTYVDAEHPNTRADRAGDAVEKKGMFPDAEALLLTLESGEPVDSIYGCWGRSEQVVDLGPKPVGESAVFRSATFIPMSVPSIRLLLRDGVVAENAAGEELRSGGVTDGFKVVPFYFSISGGELRCFLSRNAADAEASYRWEVLDGALSLSPLLLFDELPADTAYATPVPPQSQKLPFLAGKYAMAGGESDHSRELHELFHSRQAVDLLYGEVDGLDDE